MHSHQQKIIEQFTQQAVPFTQVAGHHDAIDLLVDVTHPVPEDTLLDVACGPGLVACAFANYCRHVTGLDVTPAMIEQAQKKQIDQELTNVTWKLGSCLPVPFADSSFSMVITRYSFHHFLNPSEVLAEMMRVCRPGGKVLVADVAMSPDNAKAFDQMERTRDPSHVHALTTTEFERLMHQSGLKECSLTRYKVDIELEAQIKASFPLPGDAEKLRSMITEDVGVNRLGIAPERKNGQIWYSIPIAVYVGSKAS